MAEAKSTTGCRNPVRLGCPWCAGDLLPFASPTAPHCTSGADCSATHYLASDHSLTVSGLSKTQLVAHFFEALAEHVSAGCGFVDPVDPVDQHGGVSSCEKRARTEVTSSQTETDVDDADRFPHAWPSRSRDGGAEACDHHRVRMELAPPVLTATPEDFAELVGPVRESSLQPTLENESAARGHTQRATSAPPLFYFLDCPVTGQCEFIA